MKVLPIFRYYDNSQSTIGNPLSKFEYGNIAHGLYVFGKENGSNEILLRNVAKETDEVIVLNMKTLRGFLRKEHLINN